jgi:hypothetical protein
MMSILCACSDSLSFLLALEEGKASADPANKAYAELAHGNLAEAAQLARQSPESEARIIRLIAASDGASPEMIIEALTLPVEKGLDRHTIWASLALQARLNRDQSTLKAKLKQIDPYNQTKDLARFIDAVCRPQPQEFKTAEKLLTLRPELRGQAYTAGVVYWGKKAPQLWRYGAKCLLFGSERPFFN